MRICACIHTYVYLYACYTLNISHSSHFFLLDNVDSLANSSFAKLLHSWEQTHVWLRRKDLTIHVLQYDKLVSEFEEEVRKLVSFLNFPISEESIDCVVRANANMTLFRRNRKQVEKSPFSEEQEEAIYKTIYSLEDVWNMYKVDYKKWKW